MVVPTDWKALSAAIVVPHLSGWSACLLCNNKENFEIWYKKILNRPSFTPPEWVYGAMWVTMYTSMGYASYLVWRDGGGFNGRAKTALMTYGAQLLLTNAQPVIFFQAKKKGLATIEAAAATGTVALMVALFKPINKTAFYLMLPYLGWMAFCTVVQYEFWRLNTDKTD